VIWTLGRAAGPQPGEIRGHRDKRQTPGCLAGRREDYGKDLIWQSFDRSGSIWPRACS